MCVIKSVDATTISGFCVHECEGSSRMGSRPRRYIFTGHSSGAIQMWDLTTALELNARDGGSSSGVTGGPEPSELLRLLDVCDLSNSSCPTPSCLSPSPHTPAHPQQPRHHHYPTHHSPHAHASTPMAAGPSHVLLKPANVAFLSHSQNAQQPSSSGHPSHATAAAAAAATGSSSSSGGGGGGSGIGGGEGASSAPVAGPSGAPPS